MSTIINKPYLMGWVAYFPDHHNNSRKDRENRKMIEGWIKRFVENPDGDECNSLSLVDTEYHFALVGKVFGHAAYQDDTLIMTTYVETLSRSGPNEPLRASTITGEIYYIDSGELQIVRSLNELYQHKFPTKPHDTLAL